MKLVGRLDYGLDALTLWHVGGIGDDFVLELTVRGRVTRLIVNGHEWRSLCSTSQSAPATHPYIPGRQ